MRLLRKLLPRIAVSLISIAIILAAGEYYVKNYVIASHHLVHTLMQKRWVEHYWGIPNNLGYRDREWTPEDIAGKTRILVVGDSFAEGMGINNWDDRFANVLGSELGDDYAVMLAAGSGWEPSEELMAMHRFPYDVDALVMSYFINDIDEGCSLVLGVDLLPSDLANPPGIFNDLVRKSHLADFVYWNFLARKKMQHVFKVWSDNVETCYSSEQVWHYHEAELMGLYNWSRIHGVPMVVVIFPDMVDLDRFQAQLARIKHFYEERNIPVLMLTRQWESYSLDERVVSAFDAHAGIQPNHDVGEALAQLDVLRHPQHFDFTPTLENLLTPTAYEAYRDYIAAEDPFRASDVIFVPGTDVNGSLELSTVAANLGVLNPNLSAADVHKIFDWLRTWERMQTEAELDLPEYQEAALTEWRQTKQADNLRAAGIDYVFTDSYWDAWLTEAEYANLYQSGGYEVVYNWETYTSAVYFRLLRVTDAP